MTIKALVLVAVLVAFAANVNAAPAPAASFPPSGIKNLIVFGDSYSDTGSTKSAFGAAELPYYDGRFSNGLVWNEIMAEQLGLRLINYAYANSTSDTDMAQGTVNNQKDGAVKVDGYLQLVTRYIGEDWISTKDFGESCTTVWLNGFNYWFNRDNTGDSVVSSMLSTADTLYQQGAHCFLVVKMVDPTKLPRYKALGTDDQNFISGKFKDHNAAIDNQLSKWKSDHSDSTVFLYDVNADLSTVLDPSQNPLGLKFFSDAACIGFQLVEGITECDDSTQYAFYDLYHPTTKVHEYIANKMQNVAPIS